MYKFVFIKKQEIDKDYILVNVIELVEDVNSIYELLEANIDFLYNTDGNIDYYILYKHFYDGELTKKYLIQFTESGNFGYWENGEIVEFESEQNTEIENDVYHFFYMMFSL
jgi:hypothetical protein